MRARTLALVSLLGALAAAAPARADDEAPAGGRSPLDEIEPADLEVDIPRVEFGLRFGPSFGWYSGAAHLELEARARLTEMLQLVPAVRVAGGLGTDDRNYVESGGELGVRVAKPKAVAGVGHFGVGALFLGEMEEPGGVSHVYAVPYGRIGGGVRLASDGRFFWGVEGAARFGYAVHRNPGLIDPHTLVALDRSSFFGNLDLSLVLSF